MKRYRNISHIASHDFKLSPFTLFTKSLLVLGIASLAVPVFHGCSRQCCSLDSDFTEASTKASVKLAVHNITEPGIRSVDALVFNDDILQRIDCYQHVEDIRNGTIQIGSCNGEKIVFLCANSQWGKDAWRAASSINSLKEMNVDLEDEDRLYPLMSSCRQVETGSEDAEITLERLSGIVRLRSVSCDFSGKPYAGEKITDAKVYLTNVNGSCSILQDDAERIERIINYGGLIPEDIHGFRDSSLIISHIGAITTETAYPETELVCYPNTVPEETAGAPFTRLVIEGKIQGETWYWPININRGCSNSHEGIQGNTIYTYDIVIRRKGTQDPDNPITPEAAETTFETERWSEKEEYHVAF